MERCDKQEVHSVLETAYRIIAKNPKMSMPVAIAMARWTTPKTKDLLKKISAC
jgi:hypothetical protein